MQYFSDVFTPRTWSAFLAGDRDVTAFSLGMEGRARRVAGGDRFVCYLKGKFAWVGALEATSPAYRSDVSIFGGAPFPIRVNVKPVVSLAPSDALPLQQLEGRLSFYPPGAPLSAVPSRFQGSPGLLAPGDGEAIWLALLARDDGVRPSAPELREDTFSEASDDAPPQVDAHPEMQALLASLGLLTGCSVWVPRADRARIVRSVPGFRAEALLDSLPMVFGGQAQGIVQNIDVLWLRGMTVVAAFEVENSTSIYSGLLRMSDLVASFSNIALPLYVVADESRASAVRGEVLRPTFRQIGLPPRCSFLSYQSLREFRARTPDAHLRHMSPQVITELAEPIAET